jgi:hypothetical protein
MTADWPMTDFIKDPYFLTTFRDVRLKSKSWGANAVLTKPLNYQELQTILLDISQAEDVA